MWSWVLVGGSPGRGHAARRVELSGAVNMSASSGSRLRGARSRAASGSGSSASGSRRPTPPTPGPRLHRRPHPSSLTAAATHPPITDRGPTAMPSYRRFSGQAALKDSGARAIAIRSAWTRLPQAIRPRADRWLSWEPKADCPAAPGGLVRAVRDGSGRSLPARAGQTGGVLAAPRREPAGLSVTDPLPPARRHRAGPELSVPRPRARHRARPSRSGRRRVDRGSSAR